MWERGFCESRLWNLERRIANVEGQSHPNHKQQQTIQKLKQSEGTLP